MSNSAPLLVGLCRPTATLIEICHRFCASLPFFVENLRSNYNHRPVQDYLKISDQSRSFSTASAASAVAPKQASASTLHSAPDITASSPAGSGDSVVGSVPTDASSNSALPPLLIDRSSTELGPDDVGGYYAFQDSRVPEADKPFFQAFYAPRPPEYARKGGCWGLQREFQTTGMKYLMFRQATYELIQALQSPDLNKVLLQGPSASGKSIAIAQLAEWARLNGWIVMYIPTAQALTHGGFFFKRSGTNMYDTIISAQHLLKGYMDNHSEQLDAIPRQSGLGTLLDYVKEGLATDDNAVVHQQSMLAGWPLNLLGQGAFVGQLHNCKAQLAVDSCINLCQELIQQSDKHKVLFAMDGYNFLYWHSGYGVYEDLQERRLTRTPIKVDELTLASYLRLLEKEDLKQAKVVVAYTNSASRRTYMPAPNTLRYHMPRFSEVEVANALGYYHHCGLAPTLPTQKQIDKVLALTNGNGRELRRLALKMTLLNYNTV